MYEEQVYMQQDDAYDAEETRRWLREMADAADAADGLTTEPTTNNQQPTTETCWECGGTGVDPGSLHEPEPCAVCLGAGELAPGEPYIVYDHDNQAWVKDGVYVSCGHASHDCGCFGKLHAGEPRRAA